MTAHSSDVPTARLSVRLTPRASADAVLRYESGTLFLRLTAPPVEGAANDACCRFVAGLLGVSPSQVRVRNGPKSRDKVLAVDGLAQEAVEAALARYAAPLGGAMGERAGSGRGRG